MRGAALLMAWGMAATSAASGTLVDRVVAVVDKDVLTESELRLEARVALVWREGELAGTAELGDELLEALRGYVINQTLVAVQARRLGTADVPDEDLEQRMSQFKQRFHATNGYQVFLRRFGIAETAVQEIFRRDLGNDRTLAARVRGRLSLPAEASDSAQTSQQRYENAAKLWLEELRQSAEIRLIGPEGELELQGR